MPALRPITAFILGAALLAPDLTLAQSPRLLLDPADANRDGVVSDAERADRLAAMPTEPAPIFTQWPERRPVGAKSHEPLDPGPLDMARRVAPPSEFEVALEDRFNREVRKRDKD